MFYFILTITYQYENLAQTYYIYYKQWVVKIIKFLNASLEVSC